MKSLRELKRECKTESGPYLRPFAPNVSWNKASIFIVGTNPATPLRKEFDSFDHYWDSLTRFPDQYWSAYRKRRLQDGKGNEESNTTKRVGRLKEFLEEEGVDPATILVTNAYAYPAYRSKHIPNRYVQAKIGRSIFDALVTICRPKVLFCHGMPAVRLVQNRFRKDFDPYEHPSEQPTVVHSNDANTSFVFACFHLSGQGLRSGFVLDGGWDGYLHRFAERIRAFL
jgi:hypothetical protein